MKLILSAFLFCLLSQGVNAQTTEILPQSFATASPNMAVQPVKLKPTWKWLNIGVAVQVTGNILDIASSWKQPEANSWLAQSKGPEQGKFGMGAVKKKGLISIAMIGASYAIGSKWPKTRKFLGVLNATTGTIFTGTAISNWTRENQ